MPSLVSVLVALAGMLGDPPGDPARPSPSQEEKPAKAPPAEEVPAAPETIVTAARQERDVFETPRSVTVVERKELERKNPLSAVDALRDRIGIFVEKRTTTASDPIVRGLAGRNLLALIDFNTLSTLWGEGGDGADDQYAKIDAETLERIEVIRGPASVLYGSNALGGVLNFITRRSPFDFTEQGWRAGERTRIAYGSAAQEQRLRQEVFGASPWLRLLAGYSFRDVEDTTGGRGLGVLKPTSGEFQSADVAADFRLSNTQTLSVTTTHTRLDRTHRFYRPFQDNSNDRDAYALDWRVDSEGPLWDRMEWRLYYQWKRDRRRWLDTGDRGVAKTNTYTADLQLTATPGPAHTLTYGLHYELDRGESPDDEQFTITTRDGVRTKASPDSTWHNPGAYVQDEWEAAPWLDLVGAARLDLFYFSSHVDAFYRPPGGQDPELDEIDDSQTAVTGGLGAVAHASDSVNLFADYSRGFRQNPPNFGVRQLGFGILVPNELLAPITADNVEIGMKTRSEKLRTTTAAFYTWFNDFQSIGRGSFQGSDWYDFNRNGERDPGEDVLVTKGGGRAEVHGVEAEADLKLDALDDLFHVDLFGPEWSARGGAAWELGIDHGQDQPLRFVHPAYGVATVKWEPPPPQDAVFFEFGATIVDSFERVPEDQLEDDPAFHRNPQDPTSPLLRSDGRVPGYTVFDFRAGYRLSEHAEIGLAIENLTDKKYRVAHSRIDATGINAILSLTVEF